MFNIVLFLLSQLSIRYLAILFFTVLLSGCASLAGVTTSTVDGRQSEFVVHSGKGPVVVFENGLDARMDWWKKVLPLIEPDAAYFAYNRPGYGKSTESSLPRDGDHIVEELRAVLHHQNLRPPYVLVGHSLGGLYMQLFARKYPNEVGALILVDSTHPTQMEGIGSIEKQSVWVRGLLGLMVTGVAKQELDLISVTGKQVLELPTVSNKNVFVLSASEPMKENSELAKFHNDKRVSIAKLYPGSAQIWVDSGHAIPLEKPNDVADVIREAITKVRVEGNNKQF